MGRIEKGSVGRFARISILSMLLMSAFFVVSTDAVSASQDGDYTYSVNAGVAIITGYTGAGGEIAIPSTLGGHSTAAIGADAFNSVAGHLITSVTIPDSVISIGLRAFYDCSSLTSVTLGGNVTSLGVNAFYNCGLSSVTIPNSVASIDPYAFNNCSLMTSVTIGSGVTTIGEYTFLRCSNLTSIEFFGLVAPTNVAPYWLSETNHTALMGHAYIASNFPAPGSLYPSNYSEAGEHALAMGAFIPEAPGVPTGLNAAPGNAQVSLNWTAPEFNGSSNITGYNVYRSTTEAGNYSSIASLNDTNLIDTGLTNGETYWYNVSAVNAAGEGAKTALVSSTPFTVPDAPTGLTAIAGNADVNLNWTAPAFDGGRPIDYYVVYQDSIALLDHPTGLTTIITGLTNGQSYSFNVAAHNIAGIGAQSNAATSAPRTVPDAPTGLNAIPGIALISLNWTAPIDVGGSAITNYTVYRGTSSDGETLLVTIGNVLTYIDAGLTGGQAYYYRIGAVNGAGEGAQSDEVFATPVTIPTAPTITSAAPNNGQITLIWTAPVSDGGSEITNYKLYRGTTSGSEILFVTVGNVLTYIDAGLTNGQTYYYKISAVNSIGEGPQSDEASATPATVPTAPRGLQAVAGDSMVALNWTEPSYLGPGMITYHLFRDGSEVWSGTAIAYQDAPLVKGMQYAYTVAAQNSNGWGPNCTVVLATPYGVPDAPTGLNSTDGDGKVSLNWTAPIYLGPGSIIYHLFRDQVLIWNGSGLDHVDVTVTNGITYTYEVSANNSIGWGENSTEVQATPLSAEQRPTAPRNLTAVAGFENVTLSWDAPAFSNASAVSGYLISYGTSAGSLTGQITWDQLVYVLDGLTKGTTYYFNVAAQNDAGWGPNSTTVIAVPFGMPDAPWGLNGIPGDSLSSLSWNATNYSGPGTLTYHLFRNATLIWSGVETTYNDVGLANGQFYEYNVAASNSVGWSSNSSIVGVTPQATPTAPFGLLAQIGNGFVQLNWTAPLYAGPGTLTYHLFRNGLLAYNGTAVEYNDTSAVNFVDYSYTVAAQNSVGWGPNSTAVQATPLPSQMRPTAPRDLVVTPGNEGVTLTWGVPLYSNASAVSGYMISFGTSPGSMTNQITLNQLVYVLDGLNKGVTYHFSVKAQNSAGWGANSSIESATPFGVPSEPKNLSAIAGNAQVALNWSAPSYSGPGALSYHLFRDGMLVWSGDSPPHIDSGLTNGQAYSYKVSTSNDAGWGLNSTLVQVTPLVVIMPGAPTTFQVLAGDAFVNLSWGPPTSSGSAPVTVYKIYRLTNSSIMALLTTVTSGYSYTDTAVTNGHTYYYQIRASSSVGDGAGTEILSATPEATPTVPSIFSPDTIFLLGIGVIAILVLAEVAFLIRRKRK